MGIRGIDGMSVSRATGLEITLSRHLCNRHGQPHPLPGNAAAPVNPEPPGRMTSGLG